MSTGQALILKLFPRGISVKSQTGHSSISRQQVPCRFCVYEFQTVPLPTAGSISLGSHSPWAEVGPQHRRANRPFRSPRPSTLLCPVLSPRGRRWRGRHDGAVPLPNEGLCESVPRNKKDGSLVGTGASRLKTRFRDISELLPRCRLHDGHVVPAGQVFSAARTRRARSIL